MTHSSSSRLGSSDFSSQSKPEHLIEKKTEIAEDGSVREIRHEVTSAPGMSYIHTQSVYFETNHDSDLIEPCLHIHLLYLYINGHNLLKIIHIQTSFLSKIASEILIKLMKCSCKVSV